MLVYRPVHFLYSGLAEAELDEAGEVVRPGGRALAAALVKALADEGVGVGEADQHSYYGWGFESELEGRYFYNVLNALEGEVYLTVSLGWFWLRKLFTTAPRSRPWSATASSSPRRPTLSQELRT